MPKACACDFFFRLRRLAEEGGFCKGFITSDAKDCEGASDEFLSALGLRAESLQTPGVCWFKPSLNSISTYNGANSAPLNCTTPDCPVPDMERQWMSRPSMVAACLSAATAALRQKSSSFGLARRCGFYCGP